MSTLYVDNLEPNLGSRVSAAGHVIQFKQSVHKDNISWSGTSGASSLYGTNIANRTYTLADSLTITPTSTSSILYCMAYTGWSSLTHTTTQAIGSVITLNDGSDQVIDNSDYSYYSMTYWVDLGTGAYWPRENTLGVFSPASTSEQTIRHRPYVYVESGTGAGRFTYSGLFVMEIAQ